MAIKFTAKQMEYLKACKTAEEACAAAEKANFTLSDEELDFVAGGKNTYLKQCPYCKFYVIPEEHIPYCGRNERGETFQGLFS